VHNYIENFWLISTPSVPFYLWPASSKMKKNGRSSWLMVGYLYCQLFTFSNPSYRSYIFLGVLIKLSVFDAVTMGTECIMTTLSEDPDLSFPPGFGPFAALTLQGIENNVKPADTQPSYVQVIQTIKKDVEILETSSVHCRSGTPCSTSGSSICRKSLRNRPPIDYSLFELISDDDSDAEVTEKVALACILIRISFAIP
jgi:hypothetical protein